MKIPGIIKSIYPDAIWNFKNENNKIYLTFDDGPDPEVTPEVLEILKRYSAKATFFCVGENVKRFPDIYQQIITHGHTVGNHTYNHLKGWRANTQDYIENVKLASDYIDSNLFRPPYGRIKRSQYKILNRKYTIVFWDILSFDYSKRITKEECTNKVIKNTKSGSIIVFHDAIKMKKNVLYALPKSLEYFNQKGFSTAIIGA